MSDRPEPTERELDLIQRIRSQCDFAAFNDLTLVYGQKGTEVVVAVPESLVEAVIEGWRRDNGMRVPEEEPPK
jgi:predicted DNA binding CopG/RHH family protein